MSGSEEESEAVEFGNVLEKESDVSGNNSIAPTPLPTKAVPNVAEEYLPGAASLLEQLDKRIMIVLRDGRHLVGKLRSFDQFMNLILEDTCERVLLTGKFCDFPLGLYIVRGDNIVLLGEIDAERETDTLECIDQETYIQIQCSAQPEDAPDFGKTMWDFE